MWHEAEGYPSLMTYVTDQSFFGTSNYLTEKNTPSHYRMWGEDNSITQLPSTTYLSIQSSVASDTATNVTIFGNIGGFPGFETLDTNTTTGTMLETTTNAFDSFERAAVSSPTNGYITVKSVNGSYTIAVIPEGNVRSVVRKKVQIYPLPQSVFPINIYYYKDPFPLKDSGDIHELGQEFDEAIILLSVAKLKYQDDQKEGDRFMSLYTDELRSLRKTNIDKLDFFPTLQRPWGRGVGLVAPNLSFNQVGSYYGPSSRL